MNKFDNVNIQLSTHNQLEGGMLHITITTTVGKVKNTLHSQVVLCYNTAKYQLNHNLIYLMVLLLDDAFVIGKEPAYTLNLRAIEIANKLSIKEK